ncbi:MAG TPA: sugar transferase [Candidatus Saccharimonadales bacterium]|nr:sugar transferase [Candidatus Saccharimonadales bacterium]
MKNNASLLYNFILVIGDAIAITIAFSIAYVLRVSLDHTPISSDVHAHTYLLILVGLLPFWILIFALLGLYNSRVYDRRFTEMARLLIGSFIGILFVISYSYIFNIKFFPARLVTVYGFAFAFLFVLFWRTLARGGRRQLFNYGVGINNVLIIGDTAITHELVRSLADTAATGYRVVGVVGGPKHPHKDDNDFPVFSSFDEAVKKLKKKQLHTIVQTELYPAVEDNDRILTYAQENHVAFRFVPGNSELFVGNIEVGLFQSIPIIAIHQTALVGWGRVIKRLFDLVLGTICLIIASPLMLLICILMLFDHGDPIFSQVRLSRFGTKIRIYKFRTQLHAYNRMSPEAGFAKMGRPELAEEYRKNGDYLPDDPRISKLGRFLRKTSLDELPQLINVVKGDLSLVGPRPLEPFELEQYGKKNLMLSVKSGLTGLAVVSGRRNIPFEERRRLDLYYVQNWSLWSDLVILTKTIWIVLFHRGAF